MAGYYQVDVLAGYCSVDILGIVVEICQLVSETNSLRPIHMSWSLWGVGVTVLKLKTTTLQICAAVLRRTGLVLKAHRPLHGSTLGMRVKTKKKKMQVTAADQ